MSGASAPDRRRVLAGAGAAMLFASGPAHADTLNLTVTFTLQLGAQPTPSDHR